MSVTTLLPQLPVLQLRPDEHSSLYKPPHINILTGSVLLYYYCDITWMQSNV